MMTPVSPAIVRPARTIEIGGIQDVVRAANAHYVETMPRTVFPSYLASALDIEGRMRDGTVLVAELDGRIVGTITAFADANDEGMPVRWPAGVGGLRATAVHPDAQGHGVGRALVTACLDAVAATGADMIALHTATMMVSAIALYERTGFARTPSHDFDAIDFFPGDPADTFVTMAFVRRLSVSAVD